MSVAKRANQTAAEIEAEFEEAGTPAEPVAIKSDEPGPADEALHAHNFERTRLALMRQPKVKIRCAKDEVVQINGYTFQIKGGERVEVPEQVAEILYEAGRA